MNGCIYRLKYNMSKCYMCEKSKEEDEKRGICRWCDFEGCEDKHPSSADCIRQMSDEKLADYLRWHNDLYSRNGMDWLDWLGEEAEHGCAD